MNTETYISPFSVFIFIGVILGLILSFFFIKKSSSGIEANRYQGLLILSLSLVNLDQFLNLTGYIVHILAVTNYSEPLNFIIGPLLFLFVKKSLYPDNKEKTWQHFILFFFYFFYMFFDFIQSNEYKYNSYVSSMHPDWPSLDVVEKIAGDPLNIKKLVNPVTAMQVTLYVIFSLKLLATKTENKVVSLFRTNDEMIRSLRSMVMHFLIIILIFIAVKISFSGDLGDYMIGIYISFIILITTFRVMNDSTYFDRSTSFMDIYPGKYTKSSLTESRKQEILSKISKEFENRKYYSENLASLSDLAKITGESPHHVSQVINEKLNLGFFDLLAKYRIDEAKRILQDKKTGNLTIEEISEMVGYNSKTAFNNSFKKLTGKTPSEFRRSINA